MKIVAVKFHNGVEKQYRVKGVLEPKDFVCFNLNGSLINRHRDIPVVDALDKDGVPHYFQDMSSVNVLDYMDAKQTSCIKVNGATRFAKQFPYFSIEEVFINYKPVQDTSTNL